MKSRIILLTDKAFADEIAGLLAPPDGTADIVCAYTHADLSTTLTSDLTRTRLISFGSGIIVPAAILKAVGPAYNFHPGPPNYRGLFPSVYALYDNASDFGVTCHEMSADLDSGAIVGVDTFAIAPDMDRAQLDAMAYQHLLKLITQLAPALRDVSNPLARTGHEWSGPIRRTADFEALCHLPSDCDEVEVVRRFRAIGEGPNHAITMDIDGNRVKLTRGQTGPVVRGGKEI